MRQARVRVVMVVDSTALLNERLMDAAKTTMDAQYPEELDDEMGR